MKTTLSLFLCLVMVFALTAIPAQAEEAALPSGTADFGTLEIMPMDDATAYYQQLLEAEKYNYKILRNIPSAFDPDAYEAYEASASKAIRGNRLGEKQQKLLDAAHITANKNTVPNDPQSPFVTSGVRLGTPAATSRGLNTDDFDQVAQAITYVVNEGEGGVAKAREIVAALTAKYPLI